MAVARAGSDQPWSAPACAGSPQRVAPKMCADAAPPCLLHDTASDRAASGTTMLKVAISRIRSMCGASQRVAMAWAALCRVFPRQ